MTSIELFERLQNDMNAKMGHPHLRCFNDLLDTDNAEEAMQSEMSPQEYNELKSALGSQRRQGAKRIDEWKNRKPGQAYYKDQEQCADAALIAALTSVQNPSQILLDGLNMTLSRFREMQRRLSATDNVPSGMNYDSEDDEDLDQEKIVYDGFDGRVIHHW